MSWVPPTGYTLQLNGPAVNRLYSLAVVAPPLAITNARLLSPGDPNRRVTVLSDDGRISGVLDEGASRSVVPPGAVTVDAQGGYVAPGFIDVHVHGGAGADFMDAASDAIRAACRFHASGGTTGLLATTAA